MGVERLTNWPTAACCSAVAFHQYGVICSRDEWSTVWTRSQAQTTLA